jgi:hypothetical protein
MYWFAAHVILFPNCVSAVGEHTADTYCEADGLEHVEQDPADPTALYDPALYPDVYCPAGHAALVAIVVFVSGVVPHTPVTYWSPDGVEHVVHVPAAPTALYDPALNPGAYCPTGHVFVAIVVSAVGEHTAVTY